DDGVPLPRRPPGPPPDRGHRGRGATVAPRDRPRRPPRRVGRLPSVHRRRSPADRVHPVAAGVGRRRSRHVGGDARTRHRPPARTDHHRGRAGRGAGTLRPVALTAGRGPLRSPTMRWLRDFLGWGDPWRRRRPTPAEVRFDLWLGLFLTALGVIALEALRATTI